MVVISGGGLVGAVTAIALAKEGIRSVVIDRQSLTDGAELDGRTTAVALASAYFFEELGVWGWLEPHAAPIAQIRVLEKKSPWSVDFKRKPTEDPMGYILENKDLKIAFHRRIQDFPDLIRWISPASIEERVVQNGKIMIKLSTGDCLKVPLLIVAEGKYSATCKALGVSYRVNDYQQKAIVATFYHEKSHQDTAWEVFMPAGPLAFLPLRPCAATGRFKSGMVWTLPNADADRRYAQGLAACVPDIQEHFPFLGALEPEGKQWLYPLTAQIAKSVAFPRQVVVGDAAHAMHPVAGQGVNVGWRDAQELAQLLGKQANLGLDIGSETMLRMYNGQRRSDVYALFGMTDLMIRLFSYDNPAFYFLRSSGLAIVNHLPPLKKMLMKRAMGFMK